MKEYLLLQINDALFPIGGYSHSYGLETYIQKNVVCDEKEIAEYIENRLLLALACTELLGVRLAMENADKEKYLKSLDERLTASKTPMEICNASLKLGNRFIKTLVSCKVQLKYNYFNNYAALDYTAKHHSTAYGVACASGDIAVEGALRAFAYSQCSAMITNLVKTIPLSQSLGQRLLYNCYPLLDKAVQRAMTLEEDDLCRSVPAFDIRAMEHERLYSRLYMS